ncbi:Hypothetical protein A7982_09486 [Minicystis rosea]|nr:Hypothetical protein A7982_09486 [Minicystis rosea]
MRIAFTPRAFRSLHEELPRPSDQGLGAHRPRVRSVRAIASLRWSPSTRRASGHRAQAIASAWLDGWSARSRAILSTTFTSAAVIGPSHLHSVAATFSACARRWVPIDA